LTNDEKRAHLSDLKREHLIDQVGTQEILPPESIEAAEIIILPAISCNSLKRAWIRFHRVTVSPFTNRRSEAALLMSQMGQKRPFSEVCAMSALPPML
jgi:hypothetical protein